MRETPFRLPLLPFFLHHYCCDLHKNNKSRQVQWVNPDLCVRDGGFGCRVLIACEFWLWYHTDDRMNKELWRLQAFAAGWEWGGGGGTWPPGARDPQERGAGGTDLRVSSLMVLGQEDERERTHGNFWILRCVTGKMEFYIGTQCARNVVVQAKV